MAEGCGDVPRFLLFFLVPPQAGEERGCRGTQSHGRGSGGVPAFSFFFSSRLRRDEGIPDEKPRSIEDE